MRPRIPTPAPAAAVLALAAAVALAPFAAVAPGAAASEPDAAPLADDLHIVVLPTRLLAIDARSGGQLEEDLELDERVLWSGARGRVGMALTDRRLLAVTTESGAWQSERYRRTESVPGTPLLAGRVALARTAVRVIGFDGGSGNLVETSLGPNEDVVDTAVGQNVAVAVTSRRVLGLSAQRGGFFEASLRVGERVHGVSTVANSATVSTSLRLLVFRGPSGTWEERRLQLRDRR